MPNWCENTLIVAGDKWNVKDFMDQIKTKEDSESADHANYEILENLYPTPEDLNIRATFNSDPEKDPQHEQKKANLEKYGAADWFEWRNANWGTKWGDCETQLTDQDYRDNFGKVMLSFNSAWGPPYEGIKYIATIFPRLLFDLRYYEEGMCFQGYITIMGEKIIAEQEMEFMYDSERRWEWVDEEYDALSQEHLEAL
jgi:hypothetical protein